MGITILFRTQLYPRDEERKILEKWQQTICPCCNQTLEPNPKLYKKTTFDIQASDLEKSSIIDWTFQGKWWDKEDIRFLLEGQFRHEYQKKYFDLFMLRFIPERSHIEIC